MKSNILNKILGCFLIIVMAVGMYSCDDDVNDWGTDSSHDRLFKPLVFQRGTLNATNVSINFTKIIGAKKYVFEFSNDSLEFSNIVRTVEVLADTITPYGESSTVARIAYLLQFNDFDAESNYSVRMKGVDDTKNISSDYVQLFFKTPSENIMLRPQVSAEDATLRWTPSDKVTHIDVLNIATGEVIVANSAITDDEKVLGEKYLSGLGMGTSYVANIYNAERLRGSIQFKTTGMAGSEAYNVQQGDSIHLILADFVERGKFNVTLVFEPELVYDITSIPIPAGIHSITFSAPSSETKAKLNLNKISNVSLMDGLYFENVHLNGSDVSANRLIDTNVEIQNIRFDGCDLTNYNCIVRLQNSAMLVEKVEMTNCYVFNTGGYGIFNVGGSNVEFNELIVKNCTFNEMGTQLTDVRTPVKSVSVTNCTFYNHLNQLKYLFRFDANKLPLAVYTDACIFAGDNAGMPAQATYGDYKNLSLTFAGSYKTIDMPEPTKYKFTDVTIYEKTAFDLFEDPDNGVFYIKSNAGFAGNGSAGDPRWFR